MKSNKSPYYKRHVFICVNKKEHGRTCCATSADDSFFSYMRKKLDDMGLHGVEQYRVSKSGCLGRCNLGPCLVIYPEGVWYRYDSYDDIDEIIESYLMMNKPIPRLSIDKEL
ncbi:MAG: (2Fe-2S) ferredoxin domain-containing protein [Legionella sp.]